MAEQGERTGTGKEAGGASGTTPRLYEQALDILTTEIREGTIRPGAILKESVVARRFGISRAPARRALAELARTGLAAKANGRGYVIRAPDEVALGVQIHPSSAASGKTRLQALPSWEAIYGDVENQIIGRISFASWRLNEALLARHYGVSRTVARDVIGRLQQRGLLRKDDSGRWYAPALSPTHVGELYEVRWLLEPVALVKAAPALSATFLARMRTNLEEAIARPAEVDDATLDRLEEEMHVTLLGHCDNRTLTQAITLHQSLLIAHAFLYRWTPRMFASEPFLPEHLEVVAHLQAGRVRRAEGFSKTTSRSLVNVRSRASPWSLAPSPTACLIWSASAGPDAGSGQVRDAFTS